MASKRDLLWIEALRTVAMLMVVLAHANDLCYIQAGSKAGWSVFISTVVVWAVPAFFMIAGFLLSRKPPKPRLPGDLAAFSRRKLTTLVFPFLAWNTVYLVLFKIMYGWPVWTWSSLWFMTTGYSHLYFIFLLLQFFFLYQLLEPRLQGRALDLVLGAAALCTVGFYAASDLLLWINGNDHHFFEWHYGKAFVGWSLFFFWGVWLGRRPAGLAWLSERILPLAVLTLAAFYLYFMESRVEFNRFATNARQYFLLSGLLYQMLAANLMLVLALRFIPAGADGPRGRLAGAGGDTFGIYLCHLAILILLITLWSSLGLTDTPWIKIPALLASTWLLSQALVRLMRLPGLGPVNAVFFGGRG